MEKQEAKCVSGSSAQLKSIDPWKIWLLS